jgi:hemoglobin
MKDVHAGLNITEQDWTTMANHLNATFDKFKVPQKERGEVVATLTALKPDIVMVK